MGNAKYSQLDARGVPTHGEGGEELAKGARKKLDKEYEAQEKKHKKVRGGRVVARTTQTRMHVLADSHKNACMHSQTASLSQFSDDIDRIALAQPEYVISSTKLGPFQMFVETQMSPATMLWPFADSCTPARSSSSGSSPRLQPGPALRQRESSTAVDGMSLLASSA